MSLKKTKLSTKYKQKFLTFTGVFFKIFLHPKDPSKYATDT